MSPEQAYEFILIALCVWREARGEPMETKRGVGWTIRNRVKRPSWWGTDWVSVILRPWQFSSFTAGDINVSKWPLSGDAAWKESLKVAQEVYNGTGTDPTFGGTHYFNESLKGNSPPWISELSFKTKLGALYFYG